MNRIFKTITLSLMALSLVGVVLAVSPQLLAARTPGTDASAPSGTTVSTDASRSDLIDAYNWRLTDAGCPTKKNPVQGN